MNNYNIIVLLIIVEKVPLFHSGSESMENSLVINILFTDMAQVLHTLCA